MIKLSINKKIMITNKVQIIDDCWNMPGSGYLNSGTIVQVSNSPTHLSDVRFKVIEGSGEITHRTLTKNITKDIKIGAQNLFFAQGHYTSSPYDWGFLDTNYFKEIDD